MGRIQAAIEVMGRIQAAIEAAEARKQSVFGYAGEPSINFSTEDQNRALLVGLDVDYDELHPLAARAGQFYATAAFHMPAIHSHKAAWTEGVLVGLLAASLPPQSEPDAGGESGSEGDAI